jgi:hypothetical protein
VRDALFINLLSKIEYSSVSELEREHSFPKKSKPFRSLSFSIHRVNFMELKFHSATFALNIYIAKSQTNPKALFRMAFGAHFEAA